jgi:two-component system nitrate/nitrite response regulator NarL
VTIRLAIVDDHPLVSQGVASLLANEPDIDVVGIGSSLADASSFLAEAVPPDVLLLDVKLGSESGLDLLPRTRDSSTAIVVLTAHDFGPYLAAAHRLGAAGFVVKNAPFATLLDAIRRVAAGGLAFDRRPQAEVGLTPRERAVVAQLLNGRTNDEIASALGITTRTVEAHLSRLFERLGIGSRTELATRALREGWLEVPSGS